MEVILAEKDWYVTHPLAEEITRQIPGSVVEEMGTEHGLMVRLSQNPPPDVLVLGTSLRWTDPAPIMPEVPTKVSEEGPYRAGMRVLEFLEANPNARPGVIVRWQYPDIMRDERKERNPLLQGLGVRFLPKTGELPANLARLFAKHR